MTDPNSTSPIPENDDPHFHLRQTVAHLGAASALIEIYGSDGIKDIPRIMTQILESVGAITGRVVTVETVFEDTSAEDPDASNNPTEPIDDHAGNDDDDLSEKTIQSQFGSETQDDIEDSTTDAGTPEQIGDAVTSASELGKGSETSNAASEEISQTHALSSSTADSLGETVDPETIVQLPVASEINKDAITIDGKAYELYAGEMPLLALLNEAPGVAMTPQNLLEKTKGKVPTQNQVRKTEIILFDILKRGLLVETFNDEGVEQYTINPTPEVALTDTQELDIDEMIVFLNVLDVRTLFVLGDATEPMTFRQIADALTTEWPLDEAVLNYLRRTIDKYFCPNKLVTRNDAQDPDLTQYSLPKDKLGSIKLALEKVLAENGQQTNK